MRTCLNCSEPFKPRNGKDRLCSLPCKLGALIDRSAGPDGCWPWNGWRSDAGYGLVVVHTGAGRKIERVHRIVLEQKLGRPLKTGELTRHTCPGVGNPACCNPTHLAPGNKLANILDEVERGKAMVGAPGPANLNARLDAQAIADIRASTASSATVAAAYRIDSSTVRQIRRRQTWRHVLTPAPVLMSVSVQVKSVSA
jgi:hypothetical protein